MTLTHALPLPKLETLIRWANDANERDHWGFGPAKINRLCRRYLAEKRAEYDLGHFIRLDANDLRIRLMQYADPTGNTAARNADRDLARLGRPSCAR